MNEMAVVLVPALGTALLHFLWQGVLIGLVAWLLLLVLRDARPQARYAVACVALLACVAAPVASIALALSGDGAVSARAAGPLLAGDIALGATAAAPRTVLPAPPESVLTWIVTLWAVGTAMLSLRMAGGVLWVRRLCREAHPDTDGRWLACLDRLAARMQIGRKVALRFTDQGDSPLSAGWWRPVVLLPVAIAAHMPAPLLEALIAHELAHIRRHDYLVNLLQGVVEALLFYHPVVWWLSRRIREERELVADDLAAGVLGERRRLALALSELDRLSADRPSQIPLQLAQAAHGGQLMSRIRQLVRPQPQTPRRPGTIVLPLLVLTAAGIAFYANARIADASTGFVRATSARVVAPPVALAQATAQAAPSAVARPVARLSIGNRGDRDSYALVRKGEQGFSMSGSSDDIAQIRAAQGSIDSDFLWFRRDGKAWVVRDADTLARARQAWAPTEALNTQMQALNARMQPHSDRLDALSARMDTLSEAAGGETPEMRAASEQMEALGRQMGDLGERQATLGAQLSDADEGRRAQLEKEMEALGAQQDALGAQMERHSAVMEAASRRMEQQQAPMEALGREMEAASQPMEDIGKEMEALGARIEQQAKLADGQVRRLIDAAFERGLASPAPAQR